jgi:hypothetical protein
MKAIFRIALMASLCGAPCFAQTGTIICYTSGNSVKGAAAALLPKSEQPYTGWLFDGTQRLAHMRPGRFITFHFKPGEHVVTVPWHANGPGKDRLAVNLEDGGQHCIRLSADVTNYELVPLATKNSQMNEVSCEQARREVAHMKPIDIDRVDPAVRSEFDSNPVFPSGDTSSRNP